MRKVMLLLAVVGFAGLLWAQSPFAGTWKLNVAKSKFNNPSTALKSNTVTIVALDNGLQFIFDVVDAAGKATHSEQSPLFDGKEYPVKGDPATDTVTLKRIDATSFETVNKKNGKEVQKVRVVFAKDGKSSTVTATTQDTQGKEITEISIYEKQ